MNCIVEYLINSVHKHPEKIALIDKKQQISYQTFWDMSAKVGGFIKELNMKGQPIGVIAKRNVFTPIMLMGICSSGNFYIPLDPDMPNDKFIKIIELSGLKLIISDDEEEIDNEFCRHVSLQNIISKSSIKTISESECIDNRSQEEPCALLYTSGSTGVPKGVLKSNGAFISFIESFITTFSFDEDEIIGNQTPFYFDASAKDLLLMLKLGATLVILPSEFFSFPTKLIGYMNEQKVSTILWVPSALTIVTQLNTFQEIIPTTLKKVFFVGETFPMKQFSKWREQLPHLQYVNLYGSTELAGICCYYIINKDMQLSISDSLPIGKPLSNCDVLLMSEGQPISEAYKSGEIYISSQALAIGYYKDPDNTTKSFIYDATRDNRRWFRTGDLAYYDNEGNLVFQTRKDFQIKHMGHRIELGEIETIAISLEEVEKAGCVYDNRKNKIVLFCELIKGCNLTGREIQSLLRPRLSTYMVPNKVVVLEKMLLNANGKIDRPALTQLL